MPPGSGFELFAANNQSYHRQGGEDVRDEDLLDVGVFHFSMSIAVRLPVGFATSAPPPESEDSGVTIIAAEAAQLAFARSYGHGVCRADMGWVVCVRALLHGRREQNAYHSTAGGPRIRDIVLTRELCLSGRATAVARQPSLGARFTPAGFGPPFDPPGSSATLAWLCSEAPLWVVVRVCELLRLRPNRVSGSAWRCAGTMVVLLGMRS